MSLTKAPKGYRFPVSLISHVVWLYHRFNHSYRDIREQLLYRGIDISHETIRKWCHKFSYHFRDVIKKKEGNFKDKWHLDEMNIKINGMQYILWRAVDADCKELDVFLQKRRNKKSAIRFFSRLFSSYSKPRIIVTDKLRSYQKPIKQMTPDTDHRRHKGLNNRAENSHQPTRRKEKCLIKFKSPHGVQSTLSLMGKLRNIFAVNVGRYNNKMSVQREAFQNAKLIWDNAAMILVA